LKIKNKRWHEKRYVENKMTAFYFTNHIRGKNDSLFNWVNIDINPINDMKLMLENHKNLDLN